MSGHCVQDTRIGGRLDQSVVLPEGVKRLMLIPDEMRRCVVFVYSSSGGEKKPRGTAFFVADSLPEHPSTNWVALLTAHHVIAGVRTFGDDGMVHLRLNTAGGGSTWVSTPLDDWWQPDSALDMAICFWEYRPEMNLSMLAWSLTPGIATQEVIAREGIGIGDEVFMVGLFHGHRGEDRNEPIVRVGNIAAIPLDGVQTQAYGRMPAVLIEARSIGGLSGAPVFVHMGFARWRDDQVVRSGIPNPFFLLGIMHGHWEMDETDAPYSGTGEKINSGIGIVVPAEQIMAALRPMWEIVMREK